MVGYHHGVDGLGEVFKFAKVRFRYTIGRPQRQANAMQANGVMPATRQQQFKWNAADMKEIFGMYFKKSGIRQACQNIMMMWRAQPNAGFQW